MDHQASQTAADMVRLPRCLFVPTAVSMLTSIVHPIAQVGSQFARHYYTKLHQAPNEVHKFYQRDSRLTHGEFCSSPDSPITPTQVTLVGVEVRSHAAATPATPATTGDPQAL